ncbi:MAG: hypothetical protein IKN55_08165 [Oscillospiraceae bacterium]|nr:hypothetical protein [Oscillospiraceae bacterium]
MRKKDIIRALQEIDEDTAEKLGTEYHGIADADHERLLHKIEQHLAVPEQIVPEEVQPAQKISVVTRFGAAAACAVVCFGTLGGLVWLRMHSPVQEHPETSGAPVPVVVTDPAYSIGERYAASNLTAEGTLYVKVTDASKENGLCHVTVLLESEDAVSLAGGITGDQTVFQLDNFRAAVETDGGIVYVTPCRAESTGEAGLPNTCTLEPGEQCSVELWYALPEDTQTWRLITGSSAELPYTEIVMEGSP